MVSTHTTHSRIRGGHAGAPTPLPKRRVLASNDVSLRDTKSLFLRDNASPQEQRAEIQRCANEIRRHACGEQATRLERVVELMDRQPKLQGVVAELAHPQMWATREHAMWLAMRITEAAEIIEELLRDAEITGSDDAAARGRLWLTAVGVLGSEAVDGIGDPIEDPKDPLSTGG